MARLERLYLMAVRPRPDLRVLVTVTMPEDAPAAADDELTGFFELLDLLYRKLGGSGLEIGRIREARLDTPRLALEGGEGGRIPVEQFLEIFQRWVEQEAE